MDRLTPLQTDAAVVSVQRITILNNQVTPYTNRVYNRLWQKGLAVSVVSCAAQEANRSWGHNAPTLYPHRILRGRALALGPGRYAHFSARVGAALAATRPHFLFINGFYPAMLKGALWAVFNRTPLGLITEGWRGTMPDTLLHRAIRPLVLQRCRAIVTPGNKGAEYFRDAGVAPHRIFRVPLVPAWDMPAEVPPFAARPYHLLWCAQLNDVHKNVSFFVAVAEAMKRRLPNLRVLVVGKGEAEAVVLDRLTAAGIAFTHERSVPWQRMAEMYAQARIFLLPSVWEPWGLVCDEALQCGVPALVSPQVGAADDLVVSGVNGYVLPFDVASWAERALTLASDATAWQAFSTRARSSAKARGLEHSVGAFLAMVRRL